MAQLLKFKILLASYDRYAAKEAEKKRKRVVWEERKKEQRKKKGKNVEIQVSGL